MKFPFDKKTVQRFWLRVRIGSKNECWDYLDYKPSDPGTYGQFWMNDMRRSVGAHTIS